MVHGSGDSLVHIRIAKNAIATQGWYVLGRVSHERLHRFLTREVIHFAIVSGLELA